MQISEMPNLEADVVVVGAGLAGLSAARSLKRAGRSVVVLEARERVGGRVCNRPLGDGKVAELGGEFFGTKNTLIAQTARSLGVRSYPTFDEGYRLIHYRGRTRRWRGFVPKVSRAALVDFGQAALRLERMSAKIPDDAPWAAPRAQSWDAQTLWSWCRRNMATSEGRAVMGLMTEAALCVTPCDLSLLHFLYYSKVSGGMQYMLSVEGGAQQFHFEGGAQSIALRMAENLSEELYFGAPVRAISARDDVVTVSGAGFTATARRAIVAVPIVLSCRFAFDPPLPSHRDQLATRMPPGSAIKCIMVFDEPFWREDGLTGLLACPEGPVRATFDTSPRDGRPGVLSAFVVGSAARALGRVSAAERRETVLSTCARFFGARIRSPRDYFEQNWSEEEFTRGCYHGCAATGAYTSFGPSLRAPVGRIHWAGSETGIHQMGSMGGAVDSGLRAAREIEALEAGDSTVAVGGSSPAELEPVR